VFQRQTHSDPQIQVSIAVHVFRCSPLRSSNSGGNFRSEHLPGPKFRSQNAGDNFKSSLSTSIPRYPNSGLKSQIAQSRFSQFRLSQFRSQVSGSNFRSQFQVPISDPVVPCLSLCWKRDDNIASTQVPKFRSQFQNTKLKILKTSSSISSFGKSRPNSKSSNFGSSSKIRSHLEFSFSSSSLFCFDASFQVSKFRSQFHILISSPQIQVLIFPFSSSSPFL